MRMKKIDVSQADTVTYPMITPLITASAEGSENVMATTWTTPLSMDPLFYGICIGNSHYTHELIEESGEFGVCFLDFEEVQKVLHAGRTSGRNINKFKKFNLEKMEAATISPPLIASSISALECEVTNTVEVKGSTFFIGKTLVAWVREGYLTENNVLNLKKAKPILYLGANRFSTTQKWEKWIKPKSEA